MSLKHGDPTLHSNLVLLNLTKSELAYLLDKTLHSNLVLLNS